MINRYITTTLKTTYSHYQTIKNENKTIFRLRIKNPVKRHRLRPDSSLRFDWVKISDRPVETVKIRFKSNQNLYL